MTPSTWPLRLGPFGLVPSAWLDGRSLSLNTRGKVTLTGKAGGWEIESELPKAGVLTVAVPGRKTITVNLAAGSARFPAREHAEGRAMSSPRALRG